MTQLQKLIIEHLFAGGNIAAYAHKYRLRDRKYNPLRTFGFSTYYCIKKFMRKDKAGYMVIDKNKVRKQSGHTWIKKYYKSLKKTA